MQPDLATTRRELSSSLLGASQDARLPPKWLQLSCCYYIFFTQYAVALLISPFFPTSPAGVAVGPTMVGAVFAAYSFATAAATPLPPLALRRFGTQQTVALGLTLSALGSLAFGCLPLLVSTTTPLAVGLLCCRVVGGMGASLSESACLAVVSTPGATVAAEGKHDGDDRGDGDMALAGVEISSVEVFTGVGAAAGAALGGGLYRIGADTPFGVCPLRLEPWSFRLPPIDQSSRPAETVLPLPVCGGGAAAARRRAVRLRCAAAAAAQDGRNEQRGQGPGYGGCLAAADAGNFAPAARAVARFCAGCDQHHAHGGSVRGEQPHPGASYARGIWL